MKNAFSWKIRSMLQSGKSVINCNTIFYDSSSLYNRWSISLTRHSAFHHGRRLLYCLHEKKLDILEIIIYSFWKTNIYNTHNKPFSSARKWQKIMELYFRWKNIADTYDGIGEHILLFFYSKKVETEYQLQIKDITFDCSTRDYVVLTRNMPIW